MAVGCWCCGCGCSGVELELVSKLVNEKVGLMAYLGHEESLCDFLLDSWDEVWEVLIN